MWKGTNLERTIIGTCRSIDRITQKKLNEYKKQIITKNNLFVYVTGKVNDSDMMLIEKTVSKIQISDTELNRSNFIAVPIAFGKRNAEVLKKSASYHRVRISVDVDNSVCPADIRDIIYAVLFQNENALLFLEMSENNPLVYSYNTVFEQYSNISNLQIEYEIAKKNLKDSIKAVLTVFEKLKNGEFNFENNLQKLLTQCELEQDNVCDLNWTLAYENHIMGLDPIDYSKKKFGRYANLSKEKVIECAKKVFVSSNILIAIKGDKKYIDSLDIPSLLI